MFQRVEIHSSRGPLASSFGATGIIMFGIFLIVFALLIVYMPELLAFLVAGLFASAGVSMITFGLMLRRQARFFKSNTISVDP